MIICDKCGKENDDSRFICCDCGRELVNRKQQEEPNSADRQSEAQENKNDSNKQGNCPKCGHVLVPEAKFCNKCGSSLDVDVVYCASCGEKNISTDEHCKKCGKKLGTITASTTADYKKGTQKTTIIWIIVVVCIFVMLTLSLASCALLNFVGYGRKEYRREFNLPTDRIIIEKHI